MEDTTCPVCSKEAVGRTALIGHLEFAHGIDDAEAYLRSLSAPEPRRSRLRFRKGDVTPDAPASPASPAPSTAASPAPSPASEPVRPTEPPASPAAPEPLPPSTPPVPPVPPMAPPPAATPAAGVGLDPAPGVAGAVNHPPNLTSERPGATPPADGDAEPDVTEAEPRTPYIPPAETEFHEPIGWFDEVAFQPAPVTPPAPASAEPGTPAPAPAPPGPIRGSTSSRFPELEDRPAEPAGSRRARRAAKAGPPRRARRRIALIGGIVAIVAAGGWYASTTLVDDDGTGTTTTTVPAFRAPFVIAAVAGECRTEGDTDVHEVVVTFSGARQIVFDGTSFPGDTGDGEHPLSHAVPSGEPAYLDHVLVHDDAGVEHRVEIDPPLYLPAC